MVRAYLTPLFALLLKLSALGLLISACASVEPDWGMDAGPDDELDAGAADADADAGADAAPDAEVDADSGPDVADAHLDPDTDTDPRPCGGLCRENEQCREEVCVDLCDEAGLQCGEHTRLGQAIDCGSCDFGACQEGLCVDVCAQLGAECGQVHVDGSAYTCSSCAGGEFCSPNQLCVLHQGFLDLAVGSEHTCGLRPDGSVRCWGRGDLGQLGNRSYSPSPNTAAVFAMSNATALSARTDHTCALKSDGRVSCWGKNDKGQLGTGSTSAREYQPLAVSDLLNVTAVGAGGNHSCARTQVGLVRCWGYNAQGQLGGNTTTATLDKVTVQAEGGGHFDQVLDVGTGNLHACALRTDGQVFCWGINSKQQLGISGTQAATTPRQVFNLPATRQLRAGFDHTCALTLQGQVYCWGSNSQGQLGRGTTSTSGLAQQVTLPAAAVDVAAGWTHTCAALIDGRVYCWGQNQRAQLGQASTLTLSATPREVSGVSDAYRVGAGRYHSCALTTAGDAWCWGANDNGQLGDGTYGDANNERVAPVRVAL
ncbi:hypothetical protein DL240_19305 [Lujinxingia litoralis]|uniref:RCC1-like domain-containing protein n=1 Tax=Lujinxingia litoralis TaxID=2211119 RepID=A0A328C137_9DELT|nr:RCC1 domain-containing protein [Lujinxingia litoralis]RAL19999.1 hypothetical protein DL240_19305 [Lujinxingia litoralis]